MTRASEKAPPNRDAPLGRGERLRRVRRLLALSQDEMGALAGVSGRSWQDYEREVSVPRISVYEALMMQGFNAAWLLSGEGDPKAPLSDDNLRDVSSSPGLDGPDPASDVDELMRILSHPAAVRAYQRGGVTVQVVLAAAMQHAKESDWSAEQLARLATLRNVLAEVLRESEERIGARAAHP